MLITKLRLARLCPAHICNNWVAKLPLMNYFLIISLGMLRRQFSTKALPFTKKTFSMARPMSLFSFQKRYVHQRGYNVFTGDELETDMLEMSGYIMGSRSSKDFAYVFNKCPELTESMIAYAFMRIGIPLFQLLLNLNRHHELR